jgi:hypothetical protein
MYGIHILPVPDNGTGYFAGLLIQITGRGSLRI